MLEFRDGALEIASVLGLSMRFLWPNLLWLLLAVPALVALYLYLLNRRKKSSIRFASLGLVKAAMGPGQRFRRHVPPLLFLLAMAAMLFAVARPSAVITLPNETRTIIMAIDVSLSMRANDVQPTRLQAAQSAAKVFIQDQPGDVRIGIVSFAGTASIVQAPTQNKEELVEAIDRLQLQRHTAIGSGLIVSLAALFPDAGIDVEQYVLRPGGPMRSPPTLPDPRSEKKPLVPVAPGSDPSAAIILLTDGRRTIGPDPVEVAKMAADRGVRVFTVGFGTPQGGQAQFEGYSMFMAFDGETLKAIAEVTKGEYFEAGSESDLRKIYEGLNAKYVLERRETELSAIFAAAAAVLAVAAGLLSVTWFGRYA
jgi:Ca-activated chloride channel family protein